jgi:hypothetical protein
MREDGFTYADDGHGLLRGVGGFHTLLKFAESNFDNEMINEQDPMGLGIHSLLAHDRIRMVTFSSGQPVSHTGDRALAKGITGCRQGVSGRARGRGASPHLNRQSHK